MKTPIMYEALADIRFSDLDMYGHVNSKHYLDLVFSARLTFMREQLNMTMEEIANRGIGVYLIGSNIRFVRAIRKISKVLVRSHVSEVRNRKVLVVPFEIVSFDEVEMFSNGVLEFALIDLKTSRTTEITDWLEQKFFSGMDDHSSLELEKGR